jgi:HAD superfamily hydrolase (TIGR01484 family)
MNDGYDLPADAPPLALDVDGTMTRPDGGLDSRILGPLREWPAPVVVATGKAFPYPIALCGFIGVPMNVIAETGGITHAADEVRINGDGEAARAVAEEYVEAGYDLGWGEVDLVNRWRETEVAVALDQPLKPLKEIAAAHGQEVVDTGYAYHVKDPAISKGLGLETVADALGVAPEAFVAVGDSENDVSTFDVAGWSFAVANADAAAGAAADEVTTGAHADGLLETLERVG